jgi:kynurenine 3-monooxygenase
MKIVVFGSGLVGSLYALLMTKLGHTVTVYEKRPDIRVSFSGKSRSINLALSTRGITALKSAGIFDKVEELCIPMHGRMVHNGIEAPSLQAYSQYGDYINSISRNQLNELLITEAENTGNCTFVFEAELLKPETKTSSPKIVLKNGEIIEPSADLFIGADGANSITRSYIKDCRFSVDKISHCYKEIEIPSKDNQHSIFKNALHIWPRGEFMFIGLPNLDASFTGTLFLPEMGDNSFDELRTKEDVQSFFESKFPDTLKLIPDLTEQFFENPTSNLATVWADDWFDEEKKIGLIGDAAHGIVPFYGQGMNTGFEDCRILFELMQKESFDDHFKLFADDRKKDTDAIAYLSMGNFIEMRDLVAQPTFILQKKIEAVIQKLYPENWMPLYSMVSFSNIPYRTVYEKSIQQQQIMDEIMKIESIESKFKQEELDNLEILSILKKAQVISEN